HSLHDIVRYVHECGVQAMFSLVGRRGLNKYAVKRLIADIPLVMFVLDVENGLTNEAKLAKEVKPDQFVSRPMCALWRGLSHPCVAWDPDILHYDWESYSRSTIDFINIEQSTLFSSYAVLAKNYFHALIKFGYHFVVLDGLIGPSVEANYLKMRFKGGGGLEEQRLFRLEVLKGLLRAFDFQVKKTSDFIDASFDRHEAGQTEDRTEILGMILGKTVLLDFHLRNVSDVQNCIKKVISEIKACFPSLEN
ncbi:MAG TPA: pyruvate phosphate dikinase, partial [Desulfohalobiaceae bacterium]|nr:pyruvate phosphate dikinase [Desulfohalobiaceae bacterium]